MHFKESTHRDQQQGLAAHLAANDSLQSESLRSCLSQSPLRTQSFRMVADMTCDPKVSVLEELEYRLKNELFLLTGPFKGGVVPFNIKMRGVSKKFFALDCTCVPNKVAWLTLNAILFIITVTLYIVCPCIWLFDIQRALVEHSDAPELRRSACWFCCFENHSRTNAMIS